MNKRKRNSISRRSFVQKTTLLAGTAAVGHVATEGGRSVIANDETTSKPTRPLLTPASRFGTVARGNPKPHSLQGSALSDARLTADTWRLEVAADPIVEPPHIKRAATIEKPRTLADGNAIDLPALMELGKQHGVKFIKAMQCLNISTPLGQGLWEGVPLRDVLQLCGKMNNVRRIYYWGFHNNDPKQRFQSSLSYTQVMETPPDELPAFLAYRLNGEPLSLLRGGPVRIVVPWSHGFKSIKWLRQIRITNDYRPNDTYALSNNDPESHLKTAAYLDQIPKQIQSGTSLFISGQVICGRSGLQRVEYWLRLADGEPERIANDDPRLMRGPWIACQIDGPPSWKTVLPAGVQAKDVLGFDQQTGQPRSWPLRYGLVGYSAEVRGLKPGKYEVRSRAVDLNGFAQPEPRPYPKSGINSLQVRQFEVV